MIRYSYISILICTLLFSCKSQKQEMEIRYTSLNDYDANYVFNLKNNTTGLKKIHQFTLAEIEAQKHFVDSLKNSSYMDSLPKTYQDHQYGTSLSLTATDISLYTPPQSLDRVREKEMVMEYKLDEENFTIKNIDIGDTYQSSSYTIKETKESNRCILEINNEELTLEGLYQIFEITKKLKHQFEHNIFTYQINNKQEINILDITYSNKGTSLLLNYK
ncbi:hypothetical protein [uncultured Aquimarina sp.]|uniref:hypothetical protein n=1 Tax=uncultured Aquimarina sp. TaxID=575652 RepID=UPI0026164DD7|nr:hypothetical protein [uncultured Aquimarina sp.]